MAGGSRQAARAFWLPLLCLQAAVHPLPASDTDPLHFERVGSEGGPPPEVITSVYQDRGGFVWIGSRDGLTLYDGHSFTVFEHDPSDPTSVSGNTIRTIYEDGRGNMWFGTNAGGLNRLDRGTWRFEHFRHDSADHESLSHDSVYAILEDQGGDLWIGTQQGLNRLDPTTGKLERFLSDPQDPGSLGHNYVYALHEDRDGDLWVSTVGGGLSRRDPETGRFTTYRHDPDDPATLSSDTTFAIHEDASGDLWVSSTAGLNRLDRESRRVQRFGHDASARRGLSDPLVTSIAPGPAGKLWLGTHGGGLNQLDIATGTFRAWRHDPARRFSLANDEVIALLNDSSGALWIGTWGGGLSRLTPSSLLLSRSAGKGRMPDDLDVDDVTAVHADSRGRIWIGTRSGDVVRRDPETMSDRHYVHGGDRGTPRIMLQFTEDEGGRIWIATNGGILRLDPDSGEVTELRHEPGDPTSIGPGFVQGLLVDRSGTVWVGTGEGGLNRLDGEGRVVERFRHDPNDARSLSDDYVTVLCEDRQETLWVGTRSGGLNALNRKTGEVKRYVPEAGDDTTLSHHFVTSLVEDARGTLWVGTAGGGLNRANPSSDGGYGFTRYTEAVGLIDDDVMGILTDDDGSLWLSTKRGLTRFDPDRDAFIHLFAADGLPAGEFEPGAVARSGDALYFGSVKGLVAVPAGTPFTNAAPSPTVVRSIHNAGGELHGSRPVWEMEQLEVPWGEWLSLEFAVLEYRAGHHHLYRYRLGDGDESWVELGSHRQITFTDLDPGSHDLAVQGRNSQGIWSTAMPTLQIRVIPPFWMTSWFRASMLLAVVGLAVGVHRVRTEALKKRNRQLVELHEQREKARGELSRAYDRLRGLTRRLEAAKEEERQRIARELHDEMGPALTAVIINLQLMSENQTPSQTPQRIEDTVDLVDRMIERIRDLSLDLRPPLLDELGLVPALSGYLESQARRAMIEIDVRGEAERLLPEIEIAAFRMVQEAVTNVIRHADARRTAVEVRHRGDTLELSVEDDGRGFDVGATLDGTDTGRALGLLGMRERVRMLDGEIHIESESGRGTRIRIRLPAEKQS